MGLKSSSKVRPSYPASAWFRPLPLSSLSPSLPSCPLLPKAPRIFGKIKVSPLILQGVLIARKDRPTRSGQNPPRVGKRHKLFPRSPRSWQNEAVSQRRASAEQIGFKLTLPRLFVFFSSDFFFFFPNLSLPPSPFPSSLQTAGDRGAAGRTARTCF